MKRFINLLPPEDQKQIRLAKLNTELISFGVWFGLSLLVLVALLFAGQIFLKAELNVSADHLAVKSQELDKLEQGSLKKQVEDFNLGLENFQKLEGAHENWSAILMELARLLPPGVTLDSVAVARDERKIEIAGRASTRTSALLLRTNIIASPYFVNVNFPLANLEKSIDVPWKYRFYFRPEELKENL